MLNVSIREAIPSDIGNIVKNDLIMIGESLGSETIKDHLVNSELMKYFIMETNDDKQFIGAISLWVDEDKAQINNFYIVSKFQGQGLGKKFMNHIWHEFKSNQIHEITLEVRKTNIQAIKLYETYGFRQISIRKNYYANGEDALLMYVRIGSD